MSDQTAIDPEVVARTHEGRAQRARELAVRPAAGPPSGREWSELEKMADTLAFSDLVPDHLKGKPRDVLVISLVARDLQLPTISSLSKVHVIDGVPSLAAELMRAVVKREGHEIWDEGDCTSTAARLHGRRKDSERVITVEYTIEDAEKAGLLQIVDGKAQARSSGGRKLAWEKFTADMLYARASSRLCRRVFEDVLLGVTYTPEEVSSAKELDAPLETPPEQLLPPVPEDGLPGRWDSWLERLQVAHPDAEILTAARPFYAGKGELTIELLAQASPNIPMDSKVELARRLKLLRDKREAEADDDHDEPEAAAEDAPDATEPQAITGVMLPPEELEMVGAEHAGDPPLAICGAPDPSQAEDGELLCNFAPEHDGRHSWETDGADPTAGPRSDADHCWAHEERVEGCTDCAWSGDRPTPSP